MRTWIAFLVSLSLPTLASEDELLNELEEAAAAVVDSAEFFIPAEPIEKPTPRYPGLSLRRGHEAWVHVTYCIDESGTPQNVSVAASDGDDLFERQAVRTIQKWRFEPALVNGEPSWQSRNNQVIIFALTSAQKGADRDFIRSYKKIKELIAHDDLEAADKIFQKLFDDDDLSLYEIAKVWVLRARYESLKGDPYLVDMALHRASVSGGQFIEEESYQAILAMRVKTELLLGKYSEAIQAYESLKERAGEETASVVKLEPVMSELYAAINNQSTLSTAAEIRRKGECYECNDSFVFSLVHRDFTFSDIVGELSSIEMRCDHKHLRSEISDLVEWHVPDAWGDCSLHIFGQPGTTFDVVQMPAPS